jgi:hypothetical protein
MYVNFFFKYFFGVFIIICYITIFRTGSGSFSLYNKFLQKFCNLKKFIQNLYRAGSGSGGFEKSDPHKKLSGSAGYYQYKKFFFHSAPIYRHSAADHSPWFGLVNSLLCVLKFSKVQCLFWEKTTNLSASNKLHILFITRTYYLS